LAISFSRNLLRGTINEISTNYIFFENEETYICKNEEYVCRLVSSFFSELLSPEQKPYFHRNFPPEVLMGYLTTGKT
jgi:hypothetical protein